MNLGGRDDRRRKLLLKASDQVAIPVFGFDLVTDRRKTVSQILAIV
jgi:hypothetical protein